MPIADLMYAGIQLMLLGMGIVFGFLVLLVFALKGMSRLARVFETPDDSAASASISPAAATESVPLAVIAAAIARYRADRHR